jgi:hypothetical protein
MNHRADEVLSRIVPALQQTFEDGLRAAVVTGSVIRGDFVPFYSDLDVHAFLEPQMLLDEHAPLPHLALAFRDSIGDLNPDDYGFAGFQITFVPVAFRSDWAPMLPVHYRTLVGDPVPIFGSITAERFLAHARRRLDQLPSEVATLVHTIVDKTDGVLARHSRLIGAYLKGQTYNAAVVISNDPLRIWQTTLAEVIGVAGDSIAREISGFFSEVKLWPERREESAYQRQLVRVGLNAMLGLQRWWESARDPSQRS